MSRVRCKSRQHYWQSYPNLGLSWTGLCLISQKLLEALICCSVLGTTTCRRSVAMKETHMATLTTYGLPVQVRSLLAHFMTALPSPPSLPSMRTKHTHLSREACTRSGSARILTGCSFVCIPCSNDGTAALLWRALTISCRLMCLCLCMPKAPPGQRLTFVRCQLHSSSDCVPDIAVSPSPSGCIKSK